MEKIEKGDIVVRKSHNEDILFKVEKIYADKYGKNVAILRGLTIRIMADSYEEDLVVLDKKYARDSLKFFDTRIDTRINELFNKKLNKYKKEKNYADFRTGRILHLDGDTHLSNLKKCRKISTYKQVIFNH